MNTLPGTISLFGLYLFKTKKKINYFVNDYAWHSHTIQIEHYKSK